MLCEDLEGWDGECGEKEVEEGRNILTADSHYCGTQHYKVTIF